MNANQPALLKLLPLLRLAMIMTVLVTGGIIWYLFGDESTGADGTEMGADVRQHFNLYFLVLISIAALVVMFVRRKLEQEADVQKKFAYVLVAWATAEGVALLGAIFNIWGDATFFIAGLMVLLMTFMAVPIPSGES